jgi:capsular polysaccharide biosynthesis protein
MELREYGRILGRRWPVIAILVGLVLFLSLFFHHAPAPLYRASMRFSVGIEGTQPVTAESGEGRSDAWLASEYLADDLCEVLKGGDFAHRISDQVGFTVPAGAIFATRSHRIMSVTIDWPDQAQVQSIAEAVGAAVQDAGREYFPQLEGTQAKAVLIDGPGIAPVAPSLRQRLDLPLRLLIALVAGVALAFLWDYLDNTVRDRAEVEALGLRVLGEIPHWRGRRGRRQSR